MKAHPLDALHHPSLLLYMYMYMYIHPMYNVYAYCLPDFLLALDENNSTGQPQLSELHLSGTLIIRTSQRLYYSCTEGMTDDPWKVVG